MFDHLFKWLKKKFNQTSDGVTNTSTNLSNSGSDHSNNSQRSETMTNSSVNLSDSNNSNNSNSEQFNDLVIETNNKHEPSKNNLEKCENKLQTKYPGIFDFVEKNRTEQLINNLFPLGFPKSMYISCLPSNNYERFIQYRFRPVRTQNDYLSRFLEEGKTLAFTAVFGRYGLRVNGVYETIERTRCANEIEIDFVPQNFNSGKNVKVDFLTKIQTKTIKIRDNIDSKLQVWRDYLNWREAVYFTQMRGFRYTGWEYDEEDNLYLFTVLFEKEEELKRVKGFFINNSISTCETEVSTDEFKFKYNTDNRQNRIHFNKLGDFKRLEESEKIIIEGKEYYSAIIAFEDDDKTQTPSATGFLTKNPLGDIALINRQREAINNLLMGKCNSAEIIDCLFDPVAIKNHKEVEPIHIKDWKNKDIANNDNQKEAIEKMLAAPFIFLLQGPPGTGKTTVIAEAIYQFAKLGKKVFLTSQSNDAVDNAMDRLALDSAIRALRMEKKKNNRDEEKESISEELASLQKFYNTISSELHSTWLNKWDDMDKEKSVCEEDLRDVKLLGDDFINMKKNLEQLFLRRNKAKEDVQNNKKILEEISLLDSNRINNLNYYDIYSDSIDGNLNKRFFFDLKALNIIADSLESSIKDCIEKGILLLPNSIDSLKNVENPECLNNYLFYILSSYLHLKSLIDRLRNKNNNNVNNSEAALLQIEMSKLSEELFIRVSNGENFSELTERIREINNKLIEYKNAGVFTLTAEDKDLLSKSLISDIESGKNIVGLLEKAQEKIYISLKNSLTSLEEALTSDNTDKIKDAEEKIRISEGIYNNLNDEFNLMQKEYEVIKNRLKIISEKYSITNYKKTEEIIDAINNRLNAVNDKISKSERVRSIWANLINEFDTKLNNTVSSKKELEKESEAVIDNYKGICNVISMTCTGNNSQLSKDNYEDFDVVIVDEVSKASRTELLIPLLKGKKVVLVGDHRQLPPMFDEQEKTYMELLESIDEMPENYRNLLTQENFKKFEELVTSSVFKALFENAPASIKHTLTTQYRMHPDIMAIINRFYENQLKCGIKVDQKNHSLNISDSKGNVFIRPDTHSYWLDSSLNPDGSPAYEEFAEGGTSAFNPLEIKMTINLLLKIANECKEKGVKKSVGVISFYLKQIREIRNEWKKYKNLYKDFINVDINTVDRFQGKEKNIIICSLVRNNRYGRASKHIVAFERINVAFSRAQELLVIIGAEHMYNKAEVTLPKMNIVGTETLPVYRNIINNLRANNSFFNSSSLVEAEIKEKKVKNKAKKRAKIS